MTALHDRLADLAEDAPPGGPMLDLWDRGRRLHRRRLAGTAAIVATAVVVLAVIATVDWQRSAPVPAPAGGPVGLPDQLWSPSPWLPSNDRPGRLVAVAAAERGSWTGGRRALVGVSATTGEYAFLDLPDDAGVEDGHSQLAPDGRHVAYWLTGDTTGAPAGEEDPIAGVAVYDLETGRVTRHWISTAHGLMPDELAWADADTVVFQAGQRIDENSGWTGRMSSWRLGEEPQPIAGLAQGASLLGAAYGRILVDDWSESGEEQHLLVKVESPADRRDVDLPSVGARTGSLHFVALGESGRRMALIRGSSSPEAVYAGPLDRLAEVPRTSRTLGVVDWVDSDTIVTLQQGTSPDWERTSLRRVEVSTGASRELVVLSNGLWQVATDLLDAPSVDAERPPAPMDPRVVLGLALATVLAAGGGLVVWRRRVRA
jgi:hypothetical protein